MIRTTVGEQTAQHATLRVRDGRGQSLRRRATGPRRPATAGACSRSTYTDPESFADEVTGYGADVVVLDAARGPRLRGPPARGSRRRAPGVAHERHRTARRQRAPETATDRLSRLLTMVPWLVNRQGIDLAEAAAELGVTEKQLEDRPASCSSCAATGRCPTS